MYQARQAEMPQEFPPEVDAAFYRAKYADLANLTDAGAESHYRIFGESEGRDASAAATREGFLQLVLDRHRGDLLEIGPFCQPLVRGAHVSYLDVLDSAALRARASEIGADPKGCPEKIDYVGPLEQVDRVFSAITSSHVIEHQPDLVHHLQVIGRLLENDGKYFLLIPDKRYCMDSNIAPSTIAGVVAAHHEQRKRHTLQSVIEHRAMTSHIDARRHWAGQPAVVASQEQYRRIKSALNEYLAAGENYIDVHAWYFTPQVFRELMEALWNLELINLKPLRIYGTPRDRLEFCAILQKCER